MIGFLVWFDVSRPQVLGVMSTTGLSLSAYASEDRHGHALRAAQRPGNDTDSPGGGSDRPQDSNRGIYF